MGAILPEPSPVAGDTLALSGDAGTMTAISAQDAPSLDHANGHVLLEVAPLAASPSMALALRTEPPFEELHVVQPSDVPAAPAPVQAPAGEDSLILAGQRPPLLVKSRRDRTKRNLPRPDKVLDGGSDVAPVAQKTPDQGSPGEQPTGSVTVPVEARSSVRDVETPVSQVDGPAPEALVSKVDAPADSQLAVAVEGMLCGPQVPRLAELLYALGLHLRQRKVTTAFVDVSACGATRLVASLPTGAVPPYWFETLDDATQVALIASSAHLPVRRPPDQSPAVRRSEVLVAPAPAAVSGNLPLEWLLLRWGLQIDRVNRKPCQILIDMHTPQVIVSDCKGILPNVREVRPRVTFHPGQLAVYKKGSAPAQLVTVRRLGTNQINVTLIDGTDLAIHRKWLSPLQLPG